MAQYDQEISDHAIFGHGARCSPKVAVSIYYDIFAIFVGIKVQPS